MGMAPYITKIDVAVNVMLSYCGIFSFLCTGLFCTLYFLLSSRTVSSLTVHTFFFFFFFFFFMKAVLFDCIFPSVYYQPSSQ